MLADDATTERDSEVKELPASLVILQDNLTCLETWSYSAGLVINPQKIILICFESASALAVWHSEDPSVTV